MLSSPRGTARRAVSGAPAKQQLGSIVREMQRIADDLDSRAADTSKPVLDDFAALERLSSSILRALNPAQYLVTRAESHCQARALHAVNSWGLADLVGEETATAQELAERANVRPAYLKVALRVVLQQGIFEEVGEFGSLEVRNNALSNFLRSDRPGSLQQGIAFIGDDGMRAAESLPAAAGAGEKRTAYQVAYDTDLDYFAHVALPENQMREKRMGQAMRELHSAFPDSFATEFDWGALGRGPLGDVGGGQGATPRLLGSLYPDLQFVLFDRPTTVEQSAQALSLSPLKDRVSFVGGDFFASGSVPAGHQHYLLRNVLHDWDDDEVVAILRNVREAMLAPGGASSPTLLIGDLVVTPHSSEFLQSTSIQVLSLGGGMERTLMEYRALLERAGFRLERVEHLGSLETVLVARPAE